MIATKKPSIRIALVLLIAFTLLSLGPKPLVARAAQIYYVATNGNDSNAGTLDRPWRTIQKAANSVQPGDTVFVRGGTYNESVYFRRSGQSGSLITFKNYNGESVIVRATSWVGFHLNANGLVIDGFRVFGAGSHGIFITGASYNTVQNCEFAESGWAGIQFGGDNGAATNNTVRNNNVHHNRHEGIYLRGGVEGQSGIRMSNNVIEGNDIHHNGDEGIQNTATFAPPYPDGTVIRGNRVHDNAGSWGGGMAIGGDNLMVENNIVYNNNGEVGGIWFADANNGIVRNNLVANNRGTWSYGAGGIHIHNSSNMQVLHNTVSGNSGIGIYLRDSRAVARNNILSGNSSQLRISGGSSSADRNLINGGSDTQGSNSVQGNPLFANPSAGDFHLQASSPAIDAGADVGVRNDMEGVARPQGNGYDLGAYERAVEKPAPTNTPQPTATAQPTATNVPTSTPEPTATNVPTSTPEPTATNVPTSTPEPTATAQPTATALPTKEPTTLPEPTLTPSPVPTEPANTIIIDNDDPGFAVRFSEDGWERFEMADGEHYGGSHAYNRQRGTGRDMARWYFSVPQPGIYEVYAWWWAGSWRPNNVPYRVAHAYGTSTVRMNQQTNGGKWNYLGTFAFHKDGHVTISDDVSGGQDIVADAIMLKRVGGFGRR